MADEEIKTVIVSLTPEEVQFVMNCLLNCPRQASVKEMPSLLALAQGILKKLQPQQAFPPEA